jgi:uncharacterized membrane protein
MELKKSRVKLEIDHAIVELERHVQSAKDVAAHKAAQLLDEEKAAALKDDFALAKKLKAAREVSVREGEKSVNEVRIQGELKLNKLQVGYNALRLSFVKIKPAQSMIWVVITE